MALHGAACIFYAFGEPVYILLMLGSVAVLIVGLVLAMAGERPVRFIRTGGQKEELTGKESVLQTVIYLLAVLLLFLCILRLAGGAYNPFIYFRFYIIKFFSFTLLV